MVDPNRVITLTLPPEFAQLVSQVWAQHGIDSNAINEPCIALDPGETTGVAEFDGNCTIRVYQRVTKDLGQSYDWLHETLENGCDVVLNEAGYHEWKPWGHVRGEDYRVYQWKAADHAWSPVHTIRWIGAILVAVHKTGVPFSFMMAQQAKGWWTDAKLNHYGINPVGLKHGRDALRHLLYFLLFPTKVA
jgi:hypothetical protein